MTRRCISDTRAAGRGCMLQRDQEPMNIAPLLSPLSTPMITQAFHIQQGTQLSPSKTAHSSLTEAKDWGMFYQRFKPIREETYERTKEALQTGAYSTKWMIEQLSTPTKPKLLSAESISRWRSSGLFIYQADDFPDPDSAAAMIILRRLTHDKKPHAWTPKPPIEGSFWGMPHWYCWKQDDPHAPVTHCAIPLQDDISEHTLLWTDWVGADLNNPLWLRIGTLGCCRWGRVKPHTEAGSTGQSFHWDISEHSLASWGIDTSGFQRLLQRDSPLTLHMLANLALLQLATDRLESMQALKDTLIA